MPNTDLNSRQLKELSSDADAHAAQWWSDPDDPARTEFLSLCSDYRIGLTALREQQSAKKRCASRFRDSDADKGALREQMQAISQQLSGTETRLRELGQHISVLVQAATTSRQRREAFMHWQHGDRAGAATDLDIDVQQQPPADWDQYLTAHPAGHFGLRAALITLIAEVGGHRPHFYTARDRSGALRGILPLVEMQSALFGHFAVNVPWFNYGGAIGDSAAIEAQLIDKASALLNAGCEHLELRDTRRRETLPARTDKVSMLLPLPKDSATLMNGFPAKLRAQIKRSGREDLQYRHGGSELLDDYYRVFSIHMRDLGTPVYPRRLFQRLLEEFDDCCSLHLLYLNHRPVAAAFLLRDDNVMQIPWAATLRRVHKLSANMWLYWQVLQYSIEQGCEWFDFGRSTRDAGTYRFKRQWGAEPVQHFWHYRLPGAQALPALNPDNPKFRLMIAVWQRMPVWLTRLLGPRIVVNIP